MQSAVQPSKSPRFFQFFFILLALAGLCAAKDNTKLLSPHYREWLTKDVAYIITNQEKDAFLQLPTDEARNQFMDRFWEIRNPTPGSPDNAYKIEHYRRIEYSNTYFGHASHTEGWKTDMGRVYITLGEPSQRQKLLSLQKITPMELWFYSNLNPALPPFFYVIFYQREITDEFRLYSPSGDGPERLITGAVGPTRANALKILSDDAGRDVARETLSLIPDEPVDMQTGQVSLTSDIMLGTIKSLANNPVSRQALDTRRHLLEDVSHRIVLHDEFLQVATVPLRDAFGNMNLHYVLRLTKAEDFTVGEAAKGGYYYSVLASAKVHSSDGRLILSEEKKLSKNLSQEEFDRIKDKIFGYEGWLPLPPNKYKVEFQLTNLLRGTAFRRELEIEVPELQANALQVSNMVPFTEATMVPPAAQKVLPFSGAGVKFLPIAGQKIEIAQGTDLNFFYQVWDLPATRIARAGKQLEVDYAFGRMGAGDTQTLHDQIPLDQLDAAGSILNGKRIPTEQLPPGNYRLVMTLRDPATKEKVFGTLPFGIYSTATSAASAPAWDVSDDSIADNFKNGTAYYQRALCYLAFEDKVHAIANLEKAYAKNPADELFRGKLVELYFGQQHYDRIAQLYGVTGITQATDEQTILRVAESFDKTGDAKKALVVMESGATLKPSSGPLQLALAGYYRKAGDQQKADVAEKKGKQFLAAHPES